MAKLRNFVLGTVVAALLVGPTAWADAHQPFHPSFPVHAAQGRVLPQFGAVITAVRASLPGFH